MLRCSRTPLVAAMLSLGLAVPAVSAQAPRITPKGDPSVRNDTIYSLAVKPGEYPEDRAIVLLDDGVVRLEADGRGVSTFRYVVQVLREDAVENYQEHRFGWSPGRQKLTLNWIRVLSADGKVISAGPSQVQESDVPAPLDDPVYQERKVKRVSLSGVAPNTIVDYSYTIEDVKPFLPGDFYQGWSVHMGMPVRRSRLLVDLPKSVTPRISEHNLNFARRETVAGDRRVYLWATKDVEKLRREPFASDSNGVHMRLTISSPLTWNDIGRWYGGLARDRYVLPPDLVSHVTALVKDATTLPDTIAAVHRWVAQDLRYVSISLGMGGYQPRPPAQVVETGYGDCKDKATIFVAALRALGLVAHPVLLSSGGGVDRRHPSLDQFNHAIAAVVHPDGQYTYTDLTSDLTPYGELPLSLQGEFGLVVKLDGTTEEVTLPLDPIDRNVATERIVGALSPEGRFNGRVEHVTVGARQYELRDAMRHPLDSARRANLLRALGTSLYPGGDADSLETFEGRDLRVTPRVSYMIRNARAANGSGSSLILDIPGTFGAPWTYEETARTLAEHGPRRFPIEASAVHGNSATVTEMLLTLPPGWSARVPTGITARSPFGVYESTYEQRGQVLRIQRRYAGERGTLPPERLEALVAWLKEVARDDARYIILERR